MKPAKGKIKNEIRSGRHAKTCCGTLSYIAECRGVKKVEPIRRQPPPGTVQQSRI